MRLTAKISTDLLSRVKIKLFSFLQENYGPGTFEHPVKCSFLYFAGVSLAASPRLGGYHLDTFCVFIFIPK